MSVMTGEYQHNLDAKGRLFIPAKLREDLGDVFYVTVSPYGCLFAYAEDDWENFAEKAKAIPFMERNSIRPIFSCAARCELDGQGRILLPQGLRDFAKLGKNITVIGNNDHAEFWDSEQWSAKRADELTLDNITAVMTRLDF